MKQYKFEIHAHTAETSNCGRIPAAEMIQTYHALGFDGIVITDHIHEHYVSSLNLNGDWDAVIDHFLTGYKAAKKAGGALGITVLLGAEIRYKHVNGSDYLLYGVDEAFLRGNPFLHLLTPHEFYEKFGDEILVIQAHPYRGGNEIVFEECIHGVEVFNGHAGHENRNEKALDLAKSNPRLLMTRGSDTHYAGDEGRTHMLFNSLPQNERELVACLRQTNQA